MEIGKTAENDEELKMRQCNIRTGQGCTLIYTSGTTGNPKAVMVSHDNITWTTNCFLERI